MEEWGTLPLTPAFHMFPYLFDGGTRKNQSVTAHQRKGLKSPR